MSYWKYMLRVLTKFLGYLFLWYLLILLRLYVVLTAFMPRNYPKIITSPLDGCGIVWIRFCPLEYISKFPTKLLVKLCFKNFWIFLKSCLLFKIFSPHKPTKNYHMSLKEVWHKPNLLFLFIIHVKICDKFIFLLNIL